MPMLSYRQAKAFLSRNFRDGVYVGDNPYLGDVTIQGMILRWCQAGRLAPEDYLRLKYEFG